MHLKSLTLRNIRNYENLKLDLTPGINIFIGQNGSGKSNLLEAMYFLQAGRSVRAMNEQEVIRWGETEAYLLAEVENGSGTRQIGIGIKQDRNKEIQVDRKTIIGPGELRAAVQVVLLTSKDGELVAGEPSLRRAYINQCLLAIEPEYGYQLQKLKRILISRNEILRQIRDERQKQDTLAVWNQSLQEVSGYITKKRRETTKRLQKSANNLLDKLNPESVRQINLDYKTNCPEEQKAWNNLWLIIQGEEIKQAKTLVGPQRDDLEIGIEKSQRNMNLRLFGSQGEQTLTAYVLKLSQAEIIKEEKKQNPVILADDIFAEIDETTQSRIMKYFQETEQVFITVTDPGRIKSFQAPKKIYQVGQNQCERINETTEG